MKRDVSEGLVLAGGALTFLVWALLCSAPTIAIICIAVHFIRKFW